MNKLLFFSKGLLLLCLFATQFVTAQTVSTDYATQINSTFSNLDKTRIPHKLLVDYAMEFEELSNFNGVLTSNNITNKGTYTGIYNTLLMARVNANVTGLVNPTIFKNNWDNLRQTNKIVLSGLYYKYNEFKPNAPNNTITITNGKLYDKFVGGIWQNPYDEKQVFAVTAPIVKYNSLSMQVQLPASLWYTNQVSSVQSIAIDFNDGLGYQTVTFGRIKNVTYTTAGLKEWKYKLTLTNNQILYSHSKIQIDAEIPPTTTATTYSRTINQPCSQNAFGIDEVEFNGTRQYLGATNQAILEIDYALNDCVIRKPLIVVEGYDSGLLGVENALGEVSYNNFKRTITNSFSTSLPNQLYTYDVIYINFKKGNDYMQRNAYLVEDVIKWVNSVKQGTQQNVVLGQSMGGVIARYALRDMENQLSSTGNQTWNHKTNLYISHDAPHQGANMPLSIQYFARHLIDQFVSTPLGDININMSNSGGNVSISDLETLLNQPGTKQLLNNYVASNFGINNSVGDSWRTELLNMGYPQQTRNIALSNGSHCANPQNFNPNDNLFTFNGGGQTKLLTDLLLYFIPYGNLISGISLAVLFNEPGLLIGILPGNSKFELDFWGNALPTAGATNQIYHGNVRFTKTLFKLFGWTPRITVTLTNRDYSAPGGPSYDYYPGGKYQSFISGGGTSISNVFGSFGIQMSARDNFNFIPTPSALDIGNGSVALNNADFFTKYNSATPPVAPKNSPFINFSTSFNTSGTNENHISFNTRNGNWLALELDSIATNNDNFNCSFICADSQIIGTNLLCTSSTFSAPANTSFYNWTITQGASLVNLTGNGTPNATLTALPNASGAVTLSLTMGDNGAKCGNITLTKTIWLGAPSFYLEDYYFAPQPIKSTVCAVSDNPNVTFEQQGITNIVFKLCNSNTILNGYNSTCIMPRNNCCFEVTATNACGSTTIMHDCFLNKQSANTNYYTIYPNPSNDIVNIEIRDANNLPEKGATISGELFDIMGQSKSKVEINNNKATFSVRGLNKGIYVLKIYINNQVESHQIAVE
ncbi:hypothetical protein B0A58_00765 [Flavobacterium branchiophilum NBRC 15030 = ATCC 35035]|uniref:Putative secreted protein (Por secretion system target) n=1 Tax=Flavobacterium branchiophilum TaxID=55197 RepID=A0A543FZJ1_9FLAO|nr:T9SS type A sorting domain-containing protein [Flavobacterium branchiophilum]OXA81989.1 hypothetical protein B0A58_00765 [Flavobacterium branchiophilum NBRC 15030 = ATCC 35035]TQM39256.1 putative secreted protein (Por secretion system target) [Flavobacterium branchiophilum]GEM54110.1 hypothetical protein FB1_03310 [Flavobacterium branchiophilum NBRC 15030 = ATCC 35035]